MITKKAFSLIFIISIFISGCGFKIVNEAQKIDFSFSEIKITGDKKINYNIKNKILSKTNDNKNKLLVLNIKTKKIKKIKEKNIKNEITKYEIIIIADIELQDNSYKNLDLFSVEESGNYGVAKQHSQTIASEKKLIKLLSDSLVDKIMRRLSMKNNDL